MFLTPFTRTAGIGFMVAALGTLVGCRGTIDEGPSNVTVTVQGQYEKRLLSASGFTAPPNILPTRYAFAQVINSASNQVEASGTLDASGTRTFSVPRGITFYVAIYATSEVPNTTGTGFYFYGKTKKASPSNS